MVTTPRHVFAIPAGVALWVADQLRTQGCVDRAYLGVRIDPGATADPPGAVLLGVQSLWEGVDFPGEALEVLVVARLPFSVPDDPDEFHDFQLVGRVSRPRRKPGRSHGHSSRISCPA